MNFIGETLIIECAREPWMCLGKTGTSESQTIGAVNSDVDGGYRETACLRVDGMMDERRYMEIYINQR